MPIWCVDLDGLEDAKATKKYTVEIWENGEKLPDGTQKTVGFTTYTAGSSITQQGDENGEVWNYVVKVGGTQNGADVSERWIKESPAPVTRQTNETQVQKTAETTQSTANNNPPPTPTDTESDKGGRKLFNRDVPKPGGNPLWVKGNSKFDGYGWEIKNSSEMKLTLDPVAELLNSDPNLQITIFGNTAISGMSWDEGTTERPDLKMRELATKRANAVKQFLIDEYNVDPKQIKTTIASKTGGGQSANYSITNQSPH